MLRLSIGLYNIFIQLFLAAIKLAALFNVKAKKWLNGRKNWKSELATFNAGGSVVWMHCASLGEFEQGRPVIEALKKSYPDSRVLITFFSPSGYEVRKNYSLADHTMYLPIDTKSNASAFLNSANPQLAIFIKYEFWFHYLRQLNQREIPTMLVSGAFRKNQPFFKWYGHLHRQMLTCFSKLFVLQPEACQLLKQIGILNIEFAPDTRFDRVQAIARNRQPNDSINNYLAGKTVICCGSTWPADEAYLAPIINQSSEDIAWIIAPHNIEKSFVESLQKRISISSICYTDINAESPQNCRVLIINTMGMLASLYGEADIAYIGGGFGAGIHNTLEAAVYGIPVIFGPKHTKFSEAMGLLSSGGAYAVAGADSLRSVLNELASDENKRKLAGMKAGEYVKVNLGGTEKVMQYIEQVL